MSFFLSVRRTRHEHTAGAQPSEVKIVSVYLQDLFVHVVFFWRLDPVTHCLSVHLLEFSGIDSICDDVKVSFPNVNQI